MSARTGAHQLANRSDEDVRFLSLSANAAPEICIYPDSGKLGVFGDPIEDSLYELYRRGEAVGLLGGRGAARLSAGSAAAISAGPGSRLLTTGVPSSGTDWPL